MHGGNAARRVLGSPCPGEGETALPKLARRARGGHAAPQGRAGARDAPAPWRKQGGEHGAVPIPLEILEFHSQGFFPPPRIPKGTISAVVLQDCDGNTQHRPWFETPRTAWFVNCRWFYINFVYFYTQNIYAYMQNIYIYTRFVYF